MRTMGNKHDDNDNGNDTTIKSKQEEEAE
jgi:hypothetical protein